MADLTFSTTLLGQFLEDMEAYAEVNKALLYIHQSLLLQILLKKYINVTYGCITFVEEEITEFFWGKQDQIQSVFKVHRMTMLMDG